MVKNKQNVHRILEQWIKKLKCSGSSGIGLETFTDIKVDVDPSPVDRNVSKSLDIVTSKELTSKLGQKLNTIGSESVTIDLSDSLTTVVQLRNGLRHGHCKTFSSEGDIEAIKGEYRDGELHGRAKIYFIDETWMDGYFKDGVLHGFARYFDEKGRLTFVGNHQNGLAVGTCWRIVRGGGSVVGEVDCEGRLTGDNIVYIYPDYETVLMGTFTDGVMVEAREAMVVAVKENDYGIMVPQFSQPVGKPHNR